MVKNKITITESGNWAVFFIWLILFFPIAILYWLFKIKKTMTYEKWENE